MKKIPFLLAVLGLLAFSTAAFGASDAKYKSVFRVFPGCRPPTCDNTYPPTDLTQVCGGIHENIHGYVEFQECAASRGGGWDIKVTLQGACPGFPYQVKSSHYFLGSPPIQWPAPGDMTGILVPDRRGTGTLAVHLDDADLSQLDDLICVYVDCDENANRVIDPLTEHIHLLDAWNWAHILAF